MTADQVIWTRHETRPLKRAFRKLTVLVVILTVDKEAASLFAVARYLRVPAASLFLVSDVLHEDGW